MVAAPVDFDDALPCSYEVQRGIALPTLFVGKDLGFRYPPYTDEQFWQHVLHDLEIRKAKDNAIG